MPTVWIRWPTQNRAVTTCGLKLQSFKSLFPGQACFAVPSLPEFGFISQCHTAISPSGSESVTSGSSKSYTITANTGYLISNVVVDGISKGAVSSYTFSNVTSAHSISVTFTSNASMDAGTATLGDGGSGTMSGGITKAGYGVTANLSVASQYVSNTTVTATHNFGSRSKTVSLQNGGGTWQFPVNSASSTSARKIYIPVDTADGTYTITFTVKALDPQATALMGSNVYLTQTRMAAVTGNGVMYDDDFTADW